MSDNANAATLFRKLSAVMEAVGRVPKRGYNDFQNYHYATEADISEAISVELVKQRVATLISDELIDVREWQTSRGKPTLITNVKVTITFGCLDTGAYVTVSGVGTGDDPSDKGTYKAITGGVKYALMKTFLIPTGDDPERSDTASEPVHTANIVDKEPRTHAPPARAAKAGGDSELVEAVVRLAEAQGHSGDAARTWIQAKKNKKLGLKTAVEKARKNELSEDDISKAIGESDVIGNLRDRFDAKVVDVSI